MRLLFFAATLLFCQCRKTLTSQKSAPAAKASKIDAQIVMIRGTTLDPPLRATLNTSNEAITVFGCQTYTAEPVRGTGLNVQFKDLSYNKQENCDPEQRTQIIDMFRASKKRLLPNVDEELGFTEVQFVDKYDGSTFKIRTPYPTS